MSLASLVVLWTVLLFAELRVFVVSGTIAQWYFQPPGANNTKVPSCCRERYLLSF